MTRAEREKKGEGTHIRKDLRALAVPMNLKALEARVRRCEVGEERVVRGVGAVDELERLEVVDVHPLQDPQALGRAEQGRGPPVEPDEDVLVVVVPRPVAQGEVGEVRAGYGEAGVVGVGIGED